MIACKWKLGCVAGFGPIEGAVSAVGGTSGSVEGAVVGADDISEPRMTGEWNIDTVALL